MQFGEGRERLGRGKREEGGGCRLTICVNDLYRCNVLLHMVLNQDFKKAWNVKVDKCIQVKVPLLYKIHCFTLILEKSFFLLSFKKIHVFLMHKVLYRLLATRILSKVYRTLLHNFF